MRMYSAAPPANDVVAARSYSVPKKHLDRDDLMRQVSYTPWAL